MAVKKYMKSSKKRLSKNFTTDEFACKGWDCCEYTEIDKKLVDFLQDIRNFFNSPVIINSAYRCKTHNKAVGGTEKSRHLSGMAADIKVKGIEPRKVAEFAEIIGVKGIGLYESNRDGFFVHIDTRENKAFWYGKRQLPRNTFKISSGKYSFTLPVLPEKGYFQKGDTGVQVKNMQKFLNFYGGYNLSEDGNFGRLTEKALKDFQLKEKLEADGLFGKKSLIRACEICK